MTPSGCSRSNAARRAWRRPRRCGALEPGVYSRWSIRPGAAPESSALTTRPSRRQGFTLWSLRMQGQARRERAAQPAGSRAPADREAPRPGQQRQAGTGGKHLGEVVGMPGCAVPAMAAGGSVQRDRGGRRDSPRTPPRGRRYSTPPWSAPGRAALPSRLEHAGRALGPALVIRHRVDPPEPRRDRTMSATRHQATGDVIELTPSCWSWTQGIAARRARRLTRVGHRSRRGHRAAARHVVTPRQFAGERRRQRRCCRTSAPGFGVAYLDADGARRPALYGVNCAVSPTARQLLVQERGVGSPPSRARSSTAGRRCDPVPGPGGVTPPKLRVEVPAMRAP